MSAQPESEAARPSRRLLAMAIVMLLAAAALLWGASAVQWVSLLYSTPFSGEKMAVIAGHVVRPELVPLALASLAAIAAVVATGGWLRRVIGLAVIGEAGIVAWRLFDWSSGPVFIESIPNAPPGSEPSDVVVRHPLGPAMVALAALLLLAAGLLILIRAKAMPAMGAKYSAPAAKRTYRDPDRQLWDSLDSGDDPTDPPQSSDRPR